MKDLSILIPSRKDKLLQKTLDDIALHIEIDTEVLFEEDHGRGQRALTNDLALRANGKYLMKCDSHCSFGPGFDRSMVEMMPSKAIMAPYLMRLDAETWQIKGKTATSRYCFGSDFVMQYDTEKDELVSETMCLQGSCWMVSKENYWNWNLGDETLPSWGGQGTELGIKAFLNGGRCLTNKNTYYGHVFRTLPEDFPYERGDDPGKQATEILIQRYRNPALYPLIEKFDYPLDWAAWMKKTKS